MEVQPKNFSPKKSHLPANGAKLYTNVIFRQKGETPTPSPEIYKPYEMTLNTFNEVKTLLTMKQYLLKPCNMSKSDTALV